MKKYLYYLIFMVPLVTTSVYADDPLIYGKTYSQWSAEWAEWAYAEPSATNAIKDTTGDYCDLNQDDPKVWFLAGSFGETGVVRNCTIPAGRALFYPLIEGGWIDCPLPSTDSDTPEEIIRQIIAFGRDDTSLLVSTLDGFPVSSGLMKAGEETTSIGRINTVRTQSPVFTVDLPENNVVGDAGCGQATYPAGISGRQIIDGYWVMLPPLTPGDHVLKLRGAVAKWIINYKKPIPVNRGTSPKWAFDNEVTYNLTVVE